MSIVRRKQNAEYTFFGTDATSCEVINNQIIYKWYVPKTLKFGQNQRVKVNTVGNNIGVSNIAFIEVFTSSIATNDFNYSSTAPNGDLSLYVGIVNEVVHFNNENISYPAENMFPSNQLIIKIVPRLDTYETASIDNTFTTKEKFFIKLTIYDEEPEYRTDTQGISVNDLISGKVKDNLPYR